MRFLACKECFYSGSTVGSASHLKAGDECPRGCGGIIVAFVPDEEPVPPGPIRSRLHELRAEVRGRHDAVQERLDDLEERLRAETVDLDKRVDYALRWLTVIAPYELSDGESLERLERVHDARRRGLELKLELGGPIREERLT